MDDQQDQQAPVKAVQQIHAGPLFIGLIIGLIIGVTIGVSAPNRTSWNAVAQNQDNTGACKVTEEALRARLQGRGVLPPADTMPIVTDTLSGEVVGISGNEITVKVIPLDILAPDENYVVALTSDTVIVQAKMKDYETVQAEMEAYNKQISNNMPGDNGSMPVLPQPYTKVTADESDIKVGDSISFLATEMISAPGKVTAKEIQIAEVLEVSEPPVLPDMPPVPPAFEN